MTLFGRLVKTAINVAVLPVEIVKDVVTLGGVATCQEKSYTMQQLEKIKEEADE